MPRKRIQLEIGQKCVKCGETLPAGMTAYKLSGEHGSGYEHYGKCRGVVRVESDVRKEGYKRETINDLLIIIKGGNISERIDASEEIRRRYSDALHHLEKMTFQAEAWQTDFESLANDPEYKPSYNRETVESREFLKGMGK
jgi:hypothetical protein